MFKRLALLFLIAFALNAIWENLHAYLYTAYKGAAITEFVLLRASLFDAFLITLIALPFFYFSYLRRHTWLIFVVGTVVAIGNEWYGLSTGRWEYNEFMPIVPLLNVGLTPMLQLGILGYAAFIFTGKRLVKE